MAKEIKYETIELTGLRKVRKPLLVPYIPSETVTTWDGEKWIEEDIKPPFIQHLQNRNLLQAKKSIGVEAVLAINQELAVRTQVIEAPIAVSNMLASDRVGLDWEAEGVPQRIVVNEEWASDHAIDADGDVARINTIGSNKVLNKFPITYQPAILQPVEQRVGTEFFNFLPVELDQACQQEEFEAKRYDLEKMFIKSHRDQPIGMLTSLHNVWDLWHTRHLATKEEKLERMFKNPDRYGDIELQGLKAARKDHRDGGEFEILKFNKGLKANIKPFLTGTGSVTSMSLDDLEWLERANLEKLVDKVQNLRIGEKDFITNSKPATRNEKDVLPLSYVDHVLDDQLLGRLVKCKRIKLETADGHHLPYNPAAPNSDLDSLGILMITLTLPNGTPAALTDCKRDNGQDAGLGYGFVLVPVFDAKLGKFINPAQALKKFLSTVVRVFEDGTTKVISGFDSRIQNPATGQTVGWFANQRPKDHFIKYPIKVDMLQKRLQEYCGRYGYLVDIHNGQLLAHQRKFIERMVVVDYGEPLTAEQMWPVALKAKAEIERLTDGKISLCIAGNKQTNRQIRKYPLAHPNGVALWADPMAHPARSGKQSSQLTKTLKKEKFRILVCGSDTLTQAHATPSGIQKQDTDIAFLPQVFGTKEIWENYARVNNLDPNDLSQVKEVQYYTWSGKLRKCWVTSAKQCQRTGKLIDVNANKLMLREFPHQIKDAAGNDIDLIIPIDELKAKGIVRAFTRGTTVDSFQAVTFEVRGQAITVQGLVLEKIMYRTGSASENIQGRIRTVTLRGMDGFIMGHQLEKVQNFKKVQDIDLSYPLALQRIFQVL